MSKNVAINDEYPKNDKAPLKTLWSAFWNEPVDKDDCIERKWHIFPKGTHREDICHWFEKQDKNFSVAKHLYGGPIFCKNVELIASGYEWMCPNCEKLNKEIETKTKVTCIECKKIFKVNNYEHAIGK